MANGQGFLARFLITEPQSNIGYREWRATSPRSDSDLLQFKAKLMLVLETTLPLKEGTRNQLDPARLPLSKDARTLLTEYYNATERAQRPDGDLAGVKPYASKSAEQAARIAGVLTLWEDQSASEVSAQTMADGITLAQFYLDEARRLADAAIISEKTEQAERLRRWLCAKWDDAEIMPCDIVRHGPNEFREAAKAKAALEILEGYGWVIRLQPGSVVRGASRKLAYHIYKEG